MICSITWRRCLLMIRIGKAVPLPEYIISIQGNSPVKCFRQPVKSAYFALEASTKPNSNMCMRSLARQLRFWIRLELLSRCIYESMELRTFHPQATPLSRPITSAICRHVKCRGCDQHKSGYDVPWHRHSQRLQWLPSKKAAKITLFCQTDTFWRLHDVIFPVIYVKYD